jgi:hypothetical protein
MSRSSEQVHTAEEAVGYLTECTLATIDDFCMAKNPNKGEFRRQVSIAQKGLEWTKSFCTPEQLSKIKGRVSDVIKNHGSSVKDYAIALRKKWHPENPVDLDKK